MIEIFFEGKKRELMPPQAGMVAAGCVLEIVVEDSRLTVAEGNLHIRGTAQYNRVSLLHDDPRSPFRIPVVKDPIPNF